MSAKVVLFALVFATLAVGNLEACQPNYAAYRLANQARPCTQCPQILIEESGCQSTPDQSLKCTAPVIVYYLTAQAKPCARASITCVGVSDGQHNSAVVARLNGTLESNFTSSIAEGSPAIFTPISSLQSPHTTLILTCDSEGLWVSADLEGRPLAQPLTIQCAHTLIHPVVEDFDLLGDGDSVTQETAGNSVTQETAVVEDSDLLSEGESVTQQTAVVGDSVTQETAVVGDSVTQETAVFGDSVTQEAFRA